MRARWMGEPGNPGLAHVERLAPVPPATPRPKPASSVYVDDYANSAIDEPWIDEMIRVSAAVFVLVGVTEKVLKLEGPARVMELLGMQFNTCTHVLAIPERKSKEIIILLESMLDRVDKEQSVLWHELESMTGKLMWASTTVELGKAYLRQMRKPGVVVSELLKTSTDRQRFCIPLYRFHRAVEELHWWLAVLRVCGGKLSWHVDDAGFFKAWCWNLAYGEGDVPTWVQQFATDASKWGGGVVFGYEWRARMWTVVESRQHINVLEALMILHFIEEFAH
eukprot:175127-Rhodomonas_salina.1